MNRQTQARILAIFAVVVSIVAILLATLAIATRADAFHYGFHYGDQRAQLQAMTPKPVLTSLPACLNDEAGPEFPRCVWDAVHLGNGEGRSFRLNRHGEKKYISHQRAHELLTKHESW